MTSVNGMPQLAGRNAAIVERQGFADQRRTRQQGGNPIHQQTVLEHSATEHQRQLGFTLGQREDQLRQRLDKTGRLGSGRAWAE